MIVYISSTTRSEQEELSEKDGETGCAETSDGIPSLGSVEADRTTARVGSVRDVVVRARERRRVQCGVDEAEGLLTNSETGVVDVRDDGANDGRGSGSTEYARELTVDGHNVVSAVGRNVGESAARGVVGRWGAVRWRVALQERLDLGSLVRRAREVVGEATAGIDDLIGRALRVGHLPASRHLCRADGGDIRAARGEARVEALAGRALTAIGVEAEATITRDTIVTGRVENGGAEKTEFGVLSTLTGCVRGREISLVVAIRRRDCCGEKLVIPFK